MTDAGFTIVDAAAQLRTGATTARALVDICEALNVYPLFVETQLESQRDLD